MTNIDEKDDTPITLAEAGKKLGVKARKMQIDAAAGIIPTWDDPIMRRGKVTSMAAIAQARKMAQAKARAEFEQRNALKGRR